MTSEGQIFRRAYGALDRLAPAAPDFADLGAIKLTSIAVTPGRSRWMMGLATAFVVVVVALIPVILLGPDRFPVGGSGGSGPSTSVAAGVATSTCHVGPPTTPPTPAGVGPLPTTTSTISATTTSTIAEGSVTTSPDPCFQTDTTAPSEDTTTSTIAPSTSIEVDPDRVFTMEEAEAYLREFLDHIREGSYDIASVMYAGDYQSLIEWNPDVDPGNRVALLEAGCEHQLLCDLNIREVVSGTLEGDGYRYAFMVTLERPDGSLVVWDDQDGSSRSVWPFFVINDNGVLRSHSLPLYLP